MIYRYAGAGLAAAGLMMAAPLAAQTTDTGTTAPPRDPQTPPRDPQTQPKVSPAQVIGVIQDLIKPKPSPAVFPTLSPAPQATLMPTAAPALNPAPVPTLRPAGAVRPSSTPVAQPSTVAPLPSATVSTTATSLATAADPVLETSVAVPAPLRVELSGPQPSRPLLPWWVWLTFAGAAGGLAELARRWFWPKPTIGCEIAVGPGVLTNSASPVFTAPEINIAIRIEPGEASAPTGHSVLAQGEAA